MTSTIPEDSEFDQFLDGGETDNGDGTVTVPLRHFRVMRDKVKRTRTAETEVTTLKRKVAFIEAGVDTETPAGKLLLRAYDGEIEPDAIKTAAQEVGALRKDEPAAEGQAAAAEGEKKPEAVPESEQQSAQRVADAGTGGTPATKGGDRQAAYEQALKDGGVEGLVAYMRSVGDPVIEG